MKVKSQSEVTQSCLTLCNPMDCSLPGSSVHGIFQARVLEWGAIEEISYTLIKNFFKSEERGSEKLDNLPKITQILSDMI